MVDDLLPGDDSYTLVVVVGALTDERAFDLIRDVEVEPCFGENCDIDFFLFNIFENLKSLILASD